VLAQARPAAAGTKMMRKGKYTSRAHRMTAL